MGLFGKIKNTVNAAENAVNNAKAKAVNIQVQATDAVNTVTGKKDTREYKPTEVLQYEQHKCIKVQGARYHQDFLNNLQGSTVNVQIGTEKLPEWETYPVTIGGVIVGAVSDDQLQKAMMPTGITVYAEIHRPIYNGEELTNLFIPMSNEAVEELDRKAALKLWINLDATKWQGDDAERLDFYDVEVVAIEKNGEPDYMVLGDGKRLFVISSRMKVYNDIAERAEYKPRRLIVEKKDGNLGPYYRVGFYY